MEDIILLDSSRVESTITGRYMHVINLSVVYEDKFLEQCCGLCAPELISQERNIH